MEISPQAKDHQRAKLQSDIDRFLQSGGTIKQCESGQSAIVTSERVAKEIAQAKRKLEADIQARKERREKNKEPKRDKTKYELMGRTFGFLTVIDTGKNSQNMKAWVCRCECGTITKPIPTAKLIGGHRVSCGCVKKKRGKPS